jgi:hypothetical protein
LPADAILIGMYHRRHDGLVSYTLCDTAMRGTVATWWPLHVGIGVNDEDARGLAWWQATTLPWGRIE